MELSATNYASKRQSFETRLTGVSWRPEAWSSSSSYLFSNVQ